MEDFDKKNKVSNQRNMQYLRSNKEKKENKNPYIPFDRQAEREKRKQRNKKKRNKRIFVSFIVFVMFFSLILVFVFNKNAYDIIVNNESIGFIKKTNIEAKDIENTIIATLEKQIGSKVKINEEIKIKPIKVSKKDLVTVDYIISKVKNFITYKIEAAVIKVDGNELAILSNKDEANKVLEDIKSEYLPKEDVENIEVTFLENVEVISKYVDSKEIISSDLAKEKFIQTTKVPKTYTVLKGDTISKIANVSNMTVNELYAQNPGLTTNIKQGQVLNILVDKPTISVKTIETDVFTEIEKKKIEYKVNESKPAYYQKVIQQGKNGQKEITVQTIRINGFEEEQKVISENITQEAVNEIIEVGKN